MHGNQNNLKLKRHNTPRHATPQHYSCRTHLVFFFGDYTVLFASESTRAKKAQDWLVLNATIPSSLEKLWLFMAHWSLIKLIAVASTIFEQGIVCWSYWGGCICLRPNYLSYLKLIGFSRFGVLCSPRVLSSHITFMLMILRVACSVQAQVKKFDCNMLEFK